MQVHRDVERSGPQRGRTPGGDLGTGQAESEEGARPTEEKEEAKAVRQREANHQKPTRHQEEGQILRKPAGSVNKVERGFAQRVMGDGGQRVKVAAMGDVLLLTQ